MDFIQSLICEPEDRLGSRANASVRRPRAISSAQRRSGFISHASGGVRDGGDDIKTHHWFQGLDFDRIHEQEAPFLPDLRNGTDTRYFEELGDNVQPLAAPDGADPNATKDPLLRHAAHLLDIRKATAFVGYTYRKPKAIYGARSSWARG